MADKMSPTAIVDDPFTLLPDDLLLFIAHRFMSDKDAARTAVISRKWANLWPCSRKIVLDEDSFTKVETRRTLCRHGCNSLAEGIRRTGRIEFLKFARRFAEKFSLPVVDTFRLRLSHPEEYSEQVSTWIALVANRSVKELDIDFSDGELLEELPELYTAYGQLTPAVYESSRNSLQALRLCGCHFDASRFDTFRGLNVLSISRIQLRDSILVLVIKNCKHLQELSLVKVKFEEEVKVMDDNGSLRRLTIQECPGVSFATVRTPALEYFNYTGHFIRFTIEMPQLEEAELDFCWETEFEDIGDDMANLLVGLGNAKKLTLCSYVTQVVTCGEEPNRLPAQFDTLRELILKTSLHGDELPGIALLLRSYTHLEKLFIKIGHYRPLQNYEQPVPFPGFGGTRGFWDSQHFGFPCLRTRLRYVTIEGYKESENEVMLLQFLLRKCKAMKEVILHVGNTEEYFRHAQEMRGGSNRVLPKIQIVRS